MIAPHKYDSVVGFLQAAGNFVVGLFVITGVIESKATVPDNNKQRIRTVI